MTHPDRDARTQRLGDLMSDLQQRCFCANWMCVTPTIVGLCRRALKSEELGGWANLDTNPGRDGYIIDYPFSSLDSEVPDEERITWADAPPDPRDSR